MKRLEENELASKKEKEKAWNVQINSVRNELASKKEKIEQEVKKKDSVDNEPANIKQKGEHIFNTIFGGEWTWEYKRRRSAKNEQRV